MNVAGFGLPGTSGVPVIRLWLGIAGFVVGYLYIAAPAAKLRLKCPQRTELRTRF